MTLNEGWLIIELLHDDNVDSRVCYPCEDMSEADALAEKLMKCFIQSPYVKAARAIWAIAPRTLHEVSKTDKM